MAQKGIGSRREIDKYIEMEMITVNGELAVSGQKVDDNDKIEINGMLIEEQKEKKVYFMLNKPQGYISAVKDAREKTVVELIDTPERIYPVGRLDLNTEGLLILTNDGDFNLEESKGSTGFGAKYIKARLEENYPNRWNFTSNKFDEGWESIIEIRNN